MPEWVTALCILAGFAIGALAFYFSREPGERINGSARADCRINSGRDRWGNTWHNESWPPQQGGG